MKNLSERFQEILDDKDLTQTDVVNNTSLSRRTVAGLFSGDPKHQNPTIGTVRKICEFTGANFLYLATGDGEKYPTPEPVTP